MNQLAIQLTKWVAGTDAASQITNRGMSVLKDTNVNSPTDQNPYVEALHPHPPPVRSHHRHGLLWVHP